MADATRAQVRALYWATRVPDAVAPFDTAHLKVYYPAGEPDRLSGIAAPDRSGAPYPLVVLMAGVNVPPDSYQWLASLLAASGLVVAGYTWVGELFPGQYGITPGVQLTRLRPEGVGSGPASPAVGAVIEAVAAVPDLAGVVDTTRVVLGGHSAGGSSALLSANPAWLPGVVGAFSYAGHTGASTVLGWPPATVLHCPAELPALLMSGTRDGVVAGSAARYEVDGWNPVERTFAESLRGEAAWVLFEGANHFAMGYPEDPTVARGFLDLTATTPAELTRASLAEVVTLFCHAVTGGDAGAYQAWLAAPPDTVASVSVREPAR